MKILFITPGIEDAAFGGPKGSIRNYEAMKKYGEVEVYTFRRKSSIKSLISLVKGFYPPINSEDYKEIKQIYDSKHFDMVFFDTSIYGKIVDIFKDSKKVVFFHNCEYDYIRVRFGDRFSLKKYLYSKAIHKNEGYLLKKSDYRVTFLKRDSDRLKEVYGQGADLIVPLGIKDTVSCLLDKELKNSYILLFGAAGSANIEGYGWFVKNVSPRLNCKTIVAGKGFDAYRDKWENNNVEVLGYVEDMDALYNNAFAVCVPLLSGGGMKVKVVEALMYGCTIFGTDEAFEGFDVNNNSMIVCNSPEEFISNINKYKLSNGGYNEEARLIYESTYSVESTGKLFDKMIDDLFSTNN